MSSSIEGPQKPLPRAPEAQERTPPSWVRTRWERGSRSYICSQPDPGLLEGHKSQGLTE